MSKERFECEHNWIIDNNKRKTNESLIVYDEEWNTLDDLCELLNQQDRRIEELLKANDSFGVIGNIVMEYYGKKDLCAKDVEDYANHIKEQDHKITVLERALRKILEEKWIGCPDYVIDDEFNHWLEIAESEIKNEKEGV